MDTYAPGNQATLSRQHLINRLITSVLRYIEKESGGNVTTPYVQNIAHAVAVSHAGSVTIPLLIMTIITIIIFFFIPQKVMVSPQMFCYLSVC